MKGAGLVNVVVVAAAAEIGAERLMGKLEAVRRAKTLMLAFAPLPQTCSLRQMHFMVNLPESLTIQISSTLLTSDFQKLFDPRPKCWGDAIHSQSLAPIG